MTLAFQNICKCLWVQEHMQLLSEKDDFLTREGDCLYLACIQVEVRHGYLMISSILKKQEWSMSCSHYVLSK